jgi:long-chain acyl-CoA synthetase
MTIAAQLNQIFSAHWDHPALKTDEREFTYGELYSRAGAIRDYLAKEGCGPGDTVALRLPNGSSFAAAYLACILGDFCFVPVNLELSQTDQQYILERTMPRAVLDNEAKLAAIPLTRDMSPKFDCPRRKTNAVFFTSGTTGRPKGVCHSLDRMAENVLAFNAAMGLDENTRLYHCLPMAYMAGFLNTLLSPWLAGGTVLLGPRFRPLEALQFWQRPLAWRAKAIWLIPTLAAVLVRMNRDPDIACKLSENLHSVFCGTAPLPVVVRQTFRKTFGCSLQESYGMSEILLVSAQTKAEAETSCNVGRLLPGVRAEFREAAERNDQELVIHSPYALAGYLLENGEESPLLEDGGMPTGDVGCMEKGVLVITGRLKDLIIRGGLNVSPVAIENVLLRQAGVREVAVIGLPNDFWGEAIVACLVAESGVNKELLQSDLQRLCAKDLAEGTRPDRYVWLAELPRSSTGKVQKHLLTKSLK